MLGEYFGRRGRALFATFMDDIQCRSARHKCLATPQELPDESFLGSERKGVEQAIADGGLAITASIKYPILG